MNLNVKKYPFHVYIFFDLPLLSCLLKAKWEKTEKRVREINSEIKSINLDKKMAKYISK